MSSKTTKITLLIIVFLLAAGLVTWYIVFHLIYPIPAISGLVPDTAMAYVNISNLDSKLSAIQRSEFLNNFAGSPLWKAIKSSEFWLKLNMQKEALEEGIGLDRKNAMRLLGKNIILAFFSNDYQSKYTLISELGVDTRIALTMKSTENNIASQYEFTKERYKGIRLMSITGKDWKVYYGFIGRIVILSEDISLLKDIVDIYKDSKKAVGMRPDSNEASEVKFYLNFDRLRQSSNLLNLYNFDLGNLPIFQKANILAGSIPDQKGILRFDNQILYNEDLFDEKKNSPGLDFPLPDKCLFITMHQNHNPDFLFDILEKYISPNLAIIRKTLESIILSSEAEIIVEPNRKLSLPPLVAILRVKNKAVSEAVLDGLKISMKRNTRSEIDEISYKGTVITYIKSLPGLIFPVDLGYILTESNLLIASSDLQTLKSIIDVSLGKRPSILKSKEYTGVFSSISEASDSKTFINLRLAVPILEQGAKLYEWQAKFTRNQASEKLARTISENAFILQSWNYLGIALSSEGNKSNVKFILSK